jgi:hypothetical protein
MEELCLNESNASYREVHFSLLFEITDSCDIFRPNCPVAANSACSILYVTQIMSILTATGDVAVSSRTIAAAPIFVVYLVKAK